MADDTQLIPIRSADIELGKPLPWAVYDVDRNLLLNRGIVVTSEHQVEALIERGLYRERHRHSAGAGVRTGEHVNASDDAPPPPLPQPTEETLSFDQVKLMPGDTLQLQSLLEGQSNRWMVRVIGIMPPVSVLVTSPVLDGKLIFVKDGQTFLIRAFSGLNVFAFKARILKAQLQPFPYLHLSYPDQVQAMRIRKAMRAPASIIVAVHENEAGKQTGAAKIVDISVGGAKLISPMAIGDKDQTVWLSFKVQLGDMEEYVKTPAIIRSCGKEDDEDGKPRNSFGVQFGNLATSQRLIIMNLVYQYLLKDYS